MNDPAASEAEAWSLLKARWQALQRDTPGIRARDADCCQACIRRNDGHIGTYSAIDHKVPKEEGGTDDDDNLEVICSPCHTAKTQREALRGRGVSKL